MSLQLEYKLFESHNFVGFCLCYISCTFYTAWHIVGAQYFKKSIVLLF